MKNKKETKELFVVPAFNELPDDEKKKVVKLLGKKVKINLTNISDGTKKNLSLLESKFPNGEAVVTHVYYNGEIRVESLKNTIIHQMIDYKNVEKVLK